MTRVKISNPSISLATPNDFPNTWTVLLDQVIPPFVKFRYSPKETWRDKPFTQDDLAFFSKGLLELSDFFTVDREGARLPAYFTNAKFRSSYFLYFFALQGAKFISLLDKYQQAFDAMIDHAYETGELRIIDVGSGPGTASLALLAMVLDRFEKDKTLPFRVRLIWIDRNESILKDGELLLKRWLQHLSTDWDGDIELTYEVRDWWKHPKNFNFKASIILFGNVLNESPDDSGVFAHGLVPLLEHPEGAGVLIIEPAFKSASQRIARIRDEWLSDEFQKMDPSSPIQQKKNSVWGPCLHTEACPLAHGRDWCHFSVPAKLPGKWFRNFSIRLGGVRDWLKFSFVWLAAEDTAELTPARQLKNSKQKLLRVVSDPMKTGRGNQNQVCRPHEIGFMPTPPEKPIFRGDLMMDAAPIPQHGGHHDTVFQPKNPNARNRKGVRRNSR